MRVLEQYLLSKVLFFLFYDMSFFPDLDRLFKNAENLDPDKIWILAIDEEIKQEIIRMNTKDQMFDKGVDSLNRSLGVYSKRSVEEFGKRAGRLQLFDEGTFYASFKVRVDRAGLTISADTLKTDDEGVTTDLAVRYGIDILGVTDSNQELLIRTFIERNYDRIIFNELMEGVG